MTADYPRMLFRWAHDPVVVQSEQEEAAALGEGWSRVYPPVPPLAEEGTPPEEESAAKNNKRAPTKSFDQVKQGARVKLRHDFLGRPKWQCGTVTRLRGLGAVTVRFDGEQDEHTLSMKDLIVGD